MLWWLGDEAENLGVCYVDVFYVKVKENYPKNIVVWMFINLESDKCYVIEMYVDGW